MLYDEDDGWNLEYEVQKFAGWMEKGDLQDPGYLRALKMSGLEMGIMDSARKQMGIVFPADGKQ